MACSDGDDAGAEKPKLQPYMTRAGVWTSRPVATVSAEPARASNPRSFRIPFKVQL